MDISKFLENSSNVTEVKSHHPCEIQDDKLPKNWTFEQLGGTLNLPPSSKKHVMACCKHLDLWLQMQSYSAKDINGPMIESYLNSLKTTPLPHPRSNGQNFDDSDDHNVKIGYSVASQNARKFALNKLFDNFSDPIIAKEVKSILSSNIAVKSTNAINQLDFISKNKVDKIISFCYSFKRSRTKQMLGWLVKILFQTGCRFSEISNCRISDIKYENDLAYLTVTGKGSKERTVFCYANDIEYILDFFKSQTWLFETSRGNRLDEGSSLKRLKKVSLDVIGKEINHHTLRHSRAMNLIHDEGMDITSASKFLGHSSPSITLDHYTHPTAEPEKFL
jgi:integrase